jgi:hypothetical protein
MIYLDNNTKKSNLVKQLAPNNQHNQSDQHKNNDPNDDLVRGHTIYTNEG